jgi:NitT/TauT family transport system ATP-binding protein
MSLIEASSVRLNFGTEEIYAGLDLAIAEGEFVCLLGPSGCGKSSSLRLISGLLAPSAGTITVRGKPPEAQRDLFAFVFQSPRLVPWRDALANVLLAAELRFGRIDRKAAEANARELLSLVGLERDTAKSPAQMSGGERQRVAIARALMVDPQIVLMDEPFSALDPKTRAMLRQEIISIWQRSGKTILFVTHDIDEALQLADRIFVFSGKPSRVLEAVTVDESRPRDSSALAGLRTHLQTLMHQDHQGETQ